MPLDKQAKDYARFYNQYHQEAAKLCPDASNPSTRIYDFSHDFILKEINPDDKVESFLDLGCGEGPWLKRCRGKAERMIGIDISQYILEKIPNFNNEFVLICASALDIPLEDGSIDMIFSTDVLEHVADGRQMIKECHRILKKNGKIILVTPNRHRYILLIKKLIPKKLLQKLKKRLGQDFHVSDMEQQSETLAKYDIHIHEHEYTFSELNKLLKKQGFNVEKKRGFTLVFPIPKLYDWLVKKIPIFHKFWKLIDVLTSRWPFYFVKSNLIFIAHKI